MSILWSSVLVDAISRRKAVIVIGSGVSANSTAPDGSRPPTWGQFLKDAYEALNPKPRYIRSAISQYRYLDACDYLKQCHGANWAELLRQKFVNPVYRHAAIHELIFSLDARLVISMNFDRIYEGFALPASENTLIVKNYYDPDLRQAVAGAERYLIKPHGSVESISRMIFTADDYARARNDHRNFYAVLEALLHTHTFLCLGIGLSDPDLQVLFEDYRYKYAESPHYMTMPRPISDSEIAHVRRTRGLNILPYSPRDGHRELTDSLNELVNLVGIKRDELAKAQNW